MRGDNLNWENIKFKRCPKCGGKLDFVPADEMKFKPAMYVCPVDNFAVGKQRLEQIIEDMNRPRY